MNNLQITIDYIPLIINVGIRLITAFIFLFFLIPLIFKESQVKNGLKVLRIELLLTGILIFFINTVGLIIIYFRFYGYDVRVVTEIVSYINTFGFLIYALIKLKIYTQNYSPESKARHARYDVQEKRWLNRDKKRRVK